MKTEHNNITYSIKRGCYMINIKRTGLKQFATTRLTIEKAIEARDNFLDKNPDYLFKQRTGKPLQSLTLKQLARLLNRVKEEIKKRKQNGTV